MNYVRAPLTRGAVVPMLGIVYRAMDVGPLSPASRCAVEEIFAVCGML